MSRSTKFIRLLLLLLLSSVSIVILSPLGNSSRAGRAKVNESIAVWCVGVAIFGVMHFRSRWLRRRVDEPPPADPLERAMLNWSTSDPFTARQFVDGGVAIIGRSGSGKSSSSGRALARAVVNQPGSGGLLLAAKPEDRAEWQAIFERAGRANDLLVFGPNEQLRFNIIDKESSAGGHPRNVTRVLMAVSENLRGGDARGGGEDGDFWRAQQERQLFNGVVVMQQAFGRVTAPDLQRFITTAAQTPAQIATPEWQETFHNQALKAAYAKSKSAIDAHDYEQAADYFLGELPQMADRTRSSILAGVMGVLHVFNSGIVRELVSTTTNVTPDDTLAGKFVLVDMPPSEWGEIGSFIAASWKYATQRAVLRRRVSEADSVHVIWCDEAQQFVNSFDHQYLAQCRSRRACMVYLTQSRHSFYSVLKGQSGKAEADALLSNFSTKIFHALGDVETAEWASSLVGRERQTFHGGSTPPEQGLMGLLCGIGNHTASFSEQFESILQPIEFMRGLRTGGQSNSLMCDAIVVRSGATFASGANWMKVAFSQR